MTALIVWLCGLLWLAAFVWIALSGAARTQDAVRDVYEEFDLLRLSSQVHYEIERGK